MPKIRLHNDNKKVLGVWVEPWGEDYWMKPEDQFTIVTDTPEDVHSDEAPFEVVFHDQGVSVHVNIGYEAAVYDHAGNKVDCGHQRPIEVLRTWTEASEAAADRPGLAPEVQEEARSEAETMRWRLSRAEAAEQ
ncbi:hypothetical protein ABZ605_33920 [Streptomyces sp. NPDC012765]|uniref:hypothetical protein n=1 Tax=Streptomyces sp. NPDC012765 TaxID=3155249 RepID=UPI0033F9E676